jgi:hypothetical protein
MDRTALNKESCPQRRSITFAFTILLVSCLLGSGLVSARPDSLWRHPLADAGLVLG